MALHYYNTPNNNHNPTQFPDHGAMKTNSLDAPFYKSTEMIQLLDTRIPDTHTTESQRLDFDNV